jgi:tetrahydromethanopterin S-methyltransferase subunit G
MHAVFQSAFRDVAAELGGFDATSASVHPWGGPHCWSVQQIVEHLVLSMDATRATLEERLAKGRPGRNQRRTRTEWALQLMILSAGYMPKGVGAPRETTPAESMEPSGVRELTERLETAIESLDATLDQCRQRFGMERVGRHFLLGPLRIDQWRRYHVLHLRHHLKQMCALRAALPVEVVHQPMNGEGLKPARDTRGSRGLELNASGFSVSSTRR